MTRYQFTARHFGQEKFSDMLQFFGDNVHFPTSPQNIAIGFGYSCTSIKCSVVCVKSIVIITELYRSVVFIHTYDMSGIWWLRERESISLLGKLGQSNQIVLDPSILFCFRERRSSSLSLIAEWFQDLYLLYSLLHAFWLCVLVHHLAKILIYHTHTHIRSLPEDASFSATLL